MKANIGKGYIENKWFEGGGVYIYVPPRSIMKSLLLYSVTMLLFLSCNTKKEKGTIAPYKIVYKQLDVDTTPRDILYLNGYFVCLQENLKLAVFDSNFIRRRNIEDALNYISIGNAWSNSTHDTIFFFKDDQHLLGWPKEEYYFTTRFKVQKRKYIPEDSEWPVNSEPLLVDSAYKIYANDIGYSGVFVFFYNKASKKTYVTWSHGPMQIIKFNSKYYIAEQGDSQTSPAFRIIPDPTKLVSVSDTDALNLKQLYQHQATPPSPVSYYQYLTDSIKNNSSATYGNNAGNIRHFSTPVYTFKKQENLYSLIKNDTSLYLAFHKKDSLVKIQTVLDTSIEMHRFSYSTFNNTHFITFEAWGGRGMGNKMQYFANNGFVWIKDSSIFFLYHYSHGLTDY